MPLLSRIELEAKQEGFQQGYQEGFQQGLLQGAREMLLVVLEVRFEVVPPEVIEAVNRIEDRSLLKRLHRQASQFPPSMNFSRYSNKLLRVKRKLNLEAEPRLYTIE